jgi:RNA-directed DNA polymerase
MVFATEEDARRVAGVLSKRFEKYGLRLHPDKTRLIQFRPPGLQLPIHGGIRGPESFDLLGFTHYWDRSRKGSWVVKRKTAKDRLSRTLRRIKMWCRENRHLRISVQHVALSRKLRGHGAYFGITSNQRALNVLRLRVTKIWRKWLHRRSWKGKMTWDRMNRLLKLFPLPPARVIHSVYRVANP